jgi:hypothetical protein
MKNKIMAIMISGILISFSALSQTTEKSSHPKLDALFPHAPNTTATNIPDSTKAPATNIVTNNNTMPSNNIPGTIAAPATNIVAGSNIKPVSTITYQDKPQQQAQQQVQARPEQKGIYRETRLGSSTKQYDTYEKNNNGAGSVTTSPK